MRFRLESLLIVLLSASYAVAPPSSIKVWECSIGFIGIDCSIIFQTSQKPLTAASVPLLC